MIKHKKIIIVVAIALAIVVMLGAIYLVIINKHNNKTVSAVVSQVTPTPTPSPTPSASPSPSAATPTNTVKPPVSVTPQQIAKWPVTYTQNEAASLQAVVNKKHKLPNTYIPAGLTSYGGVQLRSEASSAIAALNNDANASGYSLKMISGYRSYANQSSTYNSYVARDGQALADTYSARPGHSEHQTGLAVDVGLASGSCDLETCFGDSSAGQWLATNAQNYGFIVRYPSGKQAETGYQYEPWHLRYLGIDVAKAVYASGKTLDQYYNVEAGGY